MNLRILLRLALFSTIGTSCLADSATKPAPDPVGALLIKACEEGNENEMSVFIAEGASITAVDAEGFTPLMKAAQGAHPSIVKKLLALKAPVDTTDQYGETALNLAAWNGDADTVQQLCEAGANVNTVSQNGSTPLMGAAARGEVKISGILLDRRAAVNARTYKGTALTLAAQADQPDVVNLLLEHHADPNEIAPAHSLDDAMLTPLTYAVQKKNGAEVELLLAHGARPDLGQKGFTPFMAAAQQNLVPMMLLLQSRGARVDAQDDNGMTALHYAAEWDQLDAAKRLVGWKVNLNLRNRDGQTPLVAALQYGATEVAIYLAQNGADVNLKDNRGETALGYAQNLAYIDVVDALKARGASPVEPHIIPFPTPSHPLSAARAWGLAIAAPYLQKDGKTTLELLGHGDATDGAIRMLKDSWNITDKDSLLAELHELATSGHRSIFVPEGAKLAALDDAAFADAIAKQPDKEGALRAERSSYLKWKDRSGLAFDLVRYINLVDHGFCAHYLGEQESWDLIMPMAKKTQESFSSWQELGDNFLDGRAVWNGGPDPSFSMIIGLLDNAKDANSPWSKPWNLDLGVSVDTDTSVAQ